MLHLDLLIGGQTRRSAAAAAAAEVAPIFVVSLACGAARVTRVHCCNVKPFERGLCNCNNYISDPLCFPFCVWHFKYTRTYIVSISFAVQLDSSSMTFAACA